MMNNAKLKTVKPIPFQEEDFQLMEKLSNASGIAGREYEVRQLVLDAIKPHADEIQVDAMGNVLAIKKADHADAMKVMVAAHMDEVGFLITKDDDDGLFNFSVVGGIDKRSLIGKPVSIGRDHIPGIIGARPIHLTTADERKQPIPLEQLRIDTGLSKKSEVKPGDLAVFATKFQRSGEIIRGKALDDRLGVFNLIQCLKHAPKSIELQAAFTVQEEIGLRGARTAAFGLNPDVAFVLDATPANDLPAHDGEENTRYNTKAGCGPALYIADAATISDPRLVAFALKVAEANQIPTQIRQPGGGGTDAGAIHKTRSGVPSLSMSVPCRYIHTAISMARIADWQASLHLILAVLTNCTPSILDRK